MSSPAPHQLELEVITIEPTVPPRKPKGSSTRRQTLGSRLAVSPDEAAAVLGVSRDYFDEHVIHELRVVRRGRRSVLVALAGTPALARPERHPR